MLSWRFKAVPLQQLSATLLTLPMLGKASTQGWKTRNIAYLFGIFNLLMTPSANIQTHFISAMANGGDVTALKVRTSSSPMTQSPNASASRFHTDADPGYATKISSQRATPDSTPDTGKRAAFFDGVIVQRWKPLGSKKVKLQSFNDIQKSQPTQERFNNLKEQYTKPLFEFIRAPPKPIRNPRNIVMTMTLEVLGKARRTAVPWVLIQCNKTIAKKVRSFFKQMNVEADFKPSELTPYMPYLPILVHEESPKLAGRSYELPDPLLFEDAGISTDMAIYCDHLSIENTLCGLKIKAEIHNMICTATIGGLVLARSKDGNKSLYAITAGHFIDIDKYGEDEDDEDTDDDAYSSDDDAYSSDDEDSYELDLSFYQKNALSLEQDSGNKRIDDSTQDRKRLWFCSELGRIYRASQDDLQDGQILTGL